jgi:hypothetical protein
MRAAPAVSGAGRPANGVPSGPVPRSGVGGMGDFNARADRVTERLRRLQRLPLSA